jgi:hypothetical protein
MKQHIEINQLAELSEKGFDALIAFCIKKIYISREVMFEIAKEHPFKKEFKTTVIRDIGGRLMLNIGQMIELLKEHSDDVTTYGNIQGQSGVDLWTRGKDLESEKTDNFESTELCDALWEATKTILEGGAK